MIRPTKRVSGRYRATVMIRHDVEDGALAYAAVHAVWEPLADDEDDLIAKLAKVSRAKVEVSLRRFLWLYGDPQSWPDADWSLAVDNAAVSRVLELWPDFKAPPLYNADAADDPLRGVAEPQ